MRKKYIITAKAYCKRGRLIAQATNNYTKTHPLMQYFAEKVHLYDKLYLHAEILCMIRAGDKVVDKLVVERFNVDGSLALAKPCPVCAEAIKAYNVRNLVYTSENGYVKEKLC